MVSLLTELSYDFIQLLLKTPELILQMLHLHFVIFESTLKLLILKPLRLKLLIQKSDLSLKTLSLTRQERVNHLLAVFAELVKVVTSLEKLGFSSVILLGVESLHYEVFK